MFVDPDGLQKVTKVWNGISIVFDKEAAEFVLENGKRIKVRNAGFIDSDVCLNDLERLRNVSASTIASLRKKYGNDLTIKYDKFGQPDFSKFIKAEVSIPNPGASDYRKKAWEALQKKDKTLYDKLYPEAENYVWHHKLDGTMQLIDKELHTAYQHTGLKSVLCQLLGSVAIAVIPGGEAFKDGRINDGLRDAVYDVSPIGWGSWISSYFEWLYVSTYRDIYGKDPPRADFNSK
jgi:hypothetical protein